MKTFSPFQMATRRRKQRKTQRKLAEEIGISQISITYLETGKRQPRGTTLAKLADAFKCTIDDLFEEG